MDTETWHCRVEGGRSHTPAKTQPYNFLRQNRTCKTKSFLASNYTFQNMYQHLSAVLRITLFVHCVCLFLKCRPRCNLFFFCQKILRGGHSSAVEYIICTQRVPWFEPWYFQQKKKSSRAKRDPLRPWRAAVSSQNTQHQARWTRSGVAKLFLT